MATDRLQGVRGSIAWKPPCYVASTANLTLSSTQVVDGIAVGSCERVLVKDQTDAKLNGIYIADTGTWTRAKDWNGNRDAIPGTAVYVDRGTDGGGKAYVANSSSTAVSIDIGSTGDDVSFELMTLALTGVSAFSQNTLLPLTTQAAWQSSDGLNVFSATSVFASTDIADSAVKSTHIADAAVTLPKIVSGSTGRLLVYSTTGVLEQLAPGSSDTVLGGGTKPSYIPRGIVLQSTRVTDATQRQSTALIPTDDTIPQNTEGSTLLEATLAPISSDSNLRVRAVIPVTKNDTGTAVVSMFRDSSADAVAVAHFTSALANRNQIMVIDHEEAANSTATTTFAIRWGIGGGSTAYTIGFNSGRLFGGVYVVSLSIDELAG